MADGFRIYYIMDNSATDGVCHRTCVVDLFVYIIYCPKADICGQGVEGGGQLNADIIF